MDTVFFLRLGALVLLALGSALVLHVVATADAAADRRPRPAAPRRRSAPEAPDLREAA